MFAVFQVLKSFCSSATYFQKEAFGFETREEAQQWIHDNTPRPGHDQPGCYDWEGHLVIDRDE